MDAENEGLEWVQGAGIRQGFVTRACAPELTQPPQDSGPSTSPLLVFGDTDAPGLMMELCPNQPIVK